MGLAYPLDISRSFEGKWQPQMDAVRVRARIPLNDNHPDGERCPACSRPAPVVPIRTDHLGHGVIHHRWLCSPCGHAWTTCVRVSS